jgi:hypothetical protein
MAKRCSRCGRVYGPDAWSGLRMVERVPSDRVRELVTAWPESAAVEVRTCGCGSVIARKVESCEAG